MPPPPTDDGAAATASAGLGWRVFGRIWQDLGAEQKRAEPLVDDLLYPEQAVDGVVHAEGMGKLKAALRAHPVLEERASPNPKPNPNP